MGIISSRESSNTTPAASAQPSNDEIVSSITPSPSKGIQLSWKQQQQNHHVRQASVRSRAAQPMPDHSELDKRFAKVLVSFRILSLVSLPFGFILFIKMHLKTKANINRQKAAVLLTDFDQNAVNNKYLFSNQIDIIK